MKLCQEHKWVDLLQSGGGGKGHSHSVRWCTVCGCSEVRNSYFEPVPQTLVDLYIPEILKPNLENLHYIKKDVTTVTNGVVAHGCNCQGVMGSGVAAAIRKKWPAVFEPYRKVCDGTKSLLGTVQFIIVDECKKIVVANMFTQHRYGRDGHKYADVESVEQALYSVLDFSKNFSRIVYMPKIGCGLGGLDWDTEVRPVVEKLADQFPEVRIYVCDL